MNRGILRAWLSRVFIAIMLTVALEPVRAEQRKGGCAGTVVSVSSGAEHCLDPSDPGEREFQDCFREDGARKCGPRMVVLPPGAFLMGSPRSERGHAPEERGRGRGAGQVAVRIGPGLAVGKFEVTFAEWELCSDCRARSRDEGWGRGRRPVIHVSWDDAMVYTSWLSQRTGKAYRLLTEREWEYAARAGTKSPFATGETISTAQANYNGRLTYGEGVPGLDRRQTLPVGRFKPNAFGLHDMHGNVWEWVLDCWRGKLGGWLEPAAAASQRCVSRAFRGGSWRFDPRYLRSATRNRQPFDYTASDGGFRVAREVSPR